VEGRGLKATGSSEEIRAERRRKGEGWREQAQKRLEQRSKGRRRRGEKVSFVLIVMRRFRGPCGTVRRPDQ